MANVRGSDLLDALAFVRETHGAEAVARVLADLEPPVRGVLDAPIREQGWYPLACLRSFLMTAKALLEPQASDFYYRQGCYAARQRQQGPMEAMVADPESRMRFAKLVWHMFYDVGNLEVVGDRPETAAARIHGFPATPELCERFRGIWQGMAAQGGVAVETRCLLRGDPYCELRVVRDSIG